MNKRSLSWNKRTDREAIVQILSSGGVVAGVSDTVPGLLAPPTQEGKRVLDAIKERSNKSYLLLIDSTSKLVDWVTPAQLFQIEKLIDHCWPGPLTLILNAKPGVPNYLQSDQGTVAVRVPRHDGLLEVLKHFPALFSTSANKTDQPFPSAVDVINPAIKDSVAALVYNGQKSPAPSTIVDCTQETPQLIRKGAYPVADLEKILGIRIRQ